MRTTQRILLHTAASLLALATSSVASAAPDAPNTFDALLDQELATTGGLTADDAARDAARTSPGLHAHRAELAAAAAEVDRATLAYLPNTSVTARYARLSEVNTGSLGTLVGVPPGTPAGVVQPGTPLVAVPVKFDTPLNQITFQASLLVPVSDYFLRVAPRRAAAKLDEEAARAGVEASRLGVLADARVAYYAWVNARLRLVVAEQALGQARAHLKDAQAMFAAGTASQADVLRVESLVAKSELLLATSESLNALSERQLRTDMHAPSGRPLHIGEDIRTAPPALPPAAIATLFDEALASRPDLRSLDAAEAARERSIAVDRAAYVPRVDLFADAQYSNPNPRVFPAEAKFRGSWDAGAQLTWTFSDLPATAARVSAAEAHYEAEAAERVALVDRIQIEVSKAVEDGAVARVALASTARGLAAAEESYRTRKLLFESGRATTVELIDAETDLTSARLEALGARIDARVAEVRLAYALGRSASLTPAGRGSRLSEGRVGSP